MDTLHAESGDPLSTVLGALRLRSRVFCRSVLSAPWGFRIEARDVATWHLVVLGYAELRIDGVEGVVPMSTGDLVVLLHGHAHEATDAPGSRVTALDKLVEETPPDANGTMHTGGSGAETTLLCGGFSFDGQRPLLLDRLPPVLHHPGGGRSGASLQRVVDLVCEEIAAGQPGRGALVDRLMEMLFLQAVRAELSRTKTPDGWLPALTDPRIGRALEHVHRDLARDWTVARLAEIAGMSRTAFAERFTALVGVSVLAYVTRCRMDEATRLLRAGDADLAKVAEAVGYRSPFAFGKAFKRQLGVGPGAFRRSHVCAEIPAVTLVRAD